MIMLQQLSLNQYEHFSKTIPSSMHMLWKDSLIRADYAIKLCGSDGGGFYLGSAINKEKKIAIR